MYSKQDLLASVGKVTLAFMIIIAGILSIAFLITVISPTVSAQNNQADMQLTQPNSNIFSDNFTNSPNVVTGAFATIINGTGHFANSVADSISSGASLMANAITSASKAGLRFAFASIKLTASTIKFTFIFFGKSIIFMGKGVLLVGKFFRNTVFAIIKFPLLLLNKATGVTVKNVVVRPSDYQSAELIDPNSAELLAALTALPPSVQPTTSTDKVAYSPYDNGPIWPIKGRITTQFGVAHWPYQPTHTGLDISDGKPSGTTGIKPFRSGKVIETIKSRTGYGNHVIVDHGNGVTSLYAHLYSIEASVGQAVNTNSIIGYEGSTGMSTGTHLHFEVRVNGKVADPHKFVSGQPN